MPLLGGGPLYWAPFAPTLRLCRMTVDPLTPVHSRSQGESNNSVIAFHDNSSAIRGPKCRVATPTRPGEPSPLADAERTLHPILTAETHNFPSGVAPFPGAE